MYLNVLMTNHMWRTKWVGKDVMEWGRGEVRYFSGGSLASKIAIAFYRQIFISTFLKTTISLYIECIFSTLKTAISKQIHVDIS